MSLYRQYCPVALTAEVLCERWNILIVNRLLDGCRRFNDIHRGVPRISATLLARRLESLEHAGILVRTSLKGSRGFDYELTDAGRALEPLVTAFAEWGQHWARDMVADDLDPAFLLYSMHKRLDTNRMPGGRTVLAFEFSGAPSDCRRFWLVHENGSVDMCLKDPGFPVCLTIETDIRLFIECWRGFRDIRREIGLGKIRLHGPTDLVQRFPDWLLFSGYAGIERLRAGREQSIAARSTVSDFSKSV